MGRSDERGRAGHVGPDLPTVDFMPEQARLVGLAEGMTRSGALDSKHIWGFWAEVASSLPCSKQRDSRVPRNLASQRGWAERRPMFGFAKLPTGAS